MSNRRKLREHTASGLTRPRSTWTGKIRGAGRSPDTAGMWAMLDRLLGNLSTSRVGRDHTQLRVGGDR
jgi:hypothetical protein